MVAVPMQARRTVASVEITEPRRPLEAFELSMFGGSVERRFRRARPEIESLPWEKLDPSNHPESLVRRARRVWTEAAFQEHRTGIACAATLQSLMAARVPLDLVAMASRFPLDELVHVEMCARIADRLGGAIELLHDPSDVIVEPSRDLAPILRAADFVVRNFCVGEALSIPLLHASWRAATHPLIRGVLGRIVKDEAAHGQFGWLFLDWATDRLGPSDRLHLATVARRVIDSTRAQWATAATGVDYHSQSEALGWVNTAVYIPLAHRSLVTHVIQPLALRGIDVEVAEQGPA